MRTTQRIHLWSSPRNISTALLYAFAQRPDTTVVDEPLYAHYLSRQPTSAVHPGREATLGAQHHSGSEVVEELRIRDYGTPVVVFKQMTHHLLGLNTDRLSGMHHVLLIRAPRRILASYGRVVDEVTAEDVGLPQQEELYEKLVARGELTAVVDARRLLLDPPAVLSRLCERLGLSFDPAMLGWPAGPKPYDGVWAPYWYAGVHRSTGFLPYRDEPVELDPKLEALARKYRPVYARLLEQAI
jgi:hypothetical protein